MKKLGGYATVTAEDGSLIEEYDTCCCRHCNAIIPIKPFQLDTDSCRLCDDHICPACAKLLAQTGECSHIEKRLAFVERIAALRLKG